MAILCVNCFRKKAMHSCNCVCLLNETLLTFYIHWTSKRTRFEIEYTTESFCPDNGVPKIEKKKKRNYEYWPFVQVSAVPTSR